MAHLTIFNPPKLSKICKLKYFLLFSVICVNGLPSVLSNPFFILTLPDPSDSFIDDSVESSNEIVVIADGNLVEVEVEARGTSGVHRINSHLNSEHSRKYSKYFYDTEDSENDVGVPLLPSSSSVSGSGPPPHENVAEMARYIVRTSIWATLATISTRDPIVGFPFGNIVSVSEGTLDKSTGVPYMYVTGMDVSSIDLAKDSRATLSMTLAQSDYCHSQKYDPEDPRCARVILSGRFIKLENGTAEANFAKEAVFAKHPVMASWPSDHNFFLAKLDISNILVLDFFGGASTITTKDYFKAQPYQVRSKKAGHKSRRHAYGL